MNGPWSESRDAGNPHVRFDERDLETGPSRSPRQISTLPRIWVHTLISGRAFSRAVEAIRRPESARPGVIYRPADRAGTSEQANTAANRRNFANMLRA